MFSSTIHSPALIRISSTALLLFRRILMIAGTVSLLGLAGFFSGNTGLLDSLQAFLPADVSAAEDEDLEDADEVEAIADNGESQRPISQQSAESLSPKMRRALAYVSRR